MKSDFIDQYAINSIIHDLKQTVEEKHHGKIFLDDYLDEKGKKACMDFAVVYEISDDLRTYIHNLRRNGVRVEVNEDSLVVL